VPLHPWRFFFGFTCTFRRDLLDVIPAGSRPFDLIDPRRPLAHDRWVAFLASLVGDIYVVNDYSASTSNEKPPRTRTARSRLAAYRRRRGMRIRRLDRAWFGSSSRLAV